MAPKSSKDAQGLTSLLPLPDQPWLEPRDFYVLRVRLGEKDWADVFALDGEFVDRASQLLVDLAAAIQLTDEDVNIPQFYARLKQLLADEAPQKVWALIDEMFARCLLGWDLAEYEKARRWDKDIRVPLPNAIMPGDKRMRVIQRLPVPVLGRILYGILYHSKNF